MNTELEELILLSDTELRRPLLLEYESFLKAVDKDELFDHLLEIQDRVDRTKDRLAEISEREFNEYVSLLDIWGALAEEML